jgi:hypothetical protein
VTAARIGPMGARDRRPKATRARPLKARQAQRQARRPVCACVGADLHGKRPAVPCRAEEIAMKRGCLARAAARA